MVKIVETEEREDAEAAAAKKAKDKSKKNEKKTGKKKAAAKSKKSKTIAESENDDWVFSNAGDNNLSLNLSLTEHLGLETFEETWDKSSVSSKKSKSSKSKTKSADITSFTEKASKPKEATVSSCTRAKVKKLMSPSKRVSFSHEWKSLKLHGLINPMNEKRYSQTVLENTLSFSNETII